MSIITLRNEPIANVRRFKYLGHVLSNESSNTSAFINHQIASAYSKWNEMKSIFLDKLIFLWMRVKFLEACVRKSSAILSTSLETGFKGNAEDRIRLVWFLEANGEGWFF